MDSFNNKLSLNEKSVCKDQKFKLKLGYRDIKNIPDQPMPPIVKDLSYFRATCRDSMTNQQKYCSHRRKTDFFLNLCIIIINAGDLK